MAERGRPATRGLLVLAVWLGLVVYTLAMAFSATYSPYIADLAMPAPRETLLMVCFLGFVRAMVRREYAWVAGFGVLTYRALPSGILLMMLWLFAEIVLVRPIPVRVSSVVRAFSPLTWSSVAPTFLLRPAPTIAGR